MEEKYSSEKVVSKPKHGQPVIQTKICLSREQKRIRKWLKQVRFKRTLFSGLDEADVWKKIAELNSMYETALAAERARFDALLEERLNSTEDGKAGDDSYE